MDRNLALETVRVTEAAAIASARTVGLGDEKLSDHAAVEAMRIAFNRIEMRAKVVIGEGERDEAPMLYIGEIVGTGSGPEIELALDPLEGTTICAHGLPNSISVAAIAERGGFLHAPDVYMKKIAVGPEARGVIDLKQTWTWNLEKIAKAKGVPVSNLTVVALNRPRHEEMIKEIRDLGARIRLIQDGDVSAAIATCEPETGIDVLMGTGGAPEGVIAAAALRCLDGDFQAQLIFRKDDEKDRARKMGITDFEKIYKMEELAKGDVMFAATGVTTGTFLEGVSFFKNGCTTHSVVMRSATGTIRRLTAKHRFDIKPAVTISEYRPKTGKVSK
ncbi:MAG: class II fructose-bisphosphatase [Deltaproteobacteria bacterium]|nr:class II fructose-bisphosphatase [Deltaproteobacteria bacterium]